MLLDFWASWCAPCIAEFSSYPERKILSIGGEDRPLRGEGLQETLARLLPAPPPASSARSGS